MHEVSSVNRTRLMAAAADFKGELKPKEAYEKLIAIFAEYGLRLGQVYYVHPLRHQGERTLYMRIRTADYGAPVKWYELYLKDGIEVYSFSEREPGPLPSHFFVDGYQPGCVHP